MSVFVVSAVVDRFEELYGHVEQLLRAQPRAVAVGDELGAHAHRVVEEVFGVGERRAVVEAALGAEEALARIERAAVGDVDRFAALGHVVVSAVEGAEVSAEVDALVERESPAAHAQPEFAHAGQLPRVAEAAVALRRLEQSEVDVEVEEGLELHAHRRVDEQVVDHVLERSVLLEGEVEQREVVAVVEVVEEVAPRAENPELLARGGGVHPLPVADELDVGAAPAVVLGQDAVHAVVDEALGEREEGRRVVLVVGQVAREDAGHGPHSGRLELVVHHGLHLREELRAGFTEVLDHVGTEDQRVLLLPAQTDARGEAGGEVGARDLLGFGHGEGAAAELLVVEVGPEVDVDEELLGRESGGAEGRQQREDDSNFLHAQLQSCNQPTKVGKRFQIWLHLHPN